MTHKKRESEREKKLNQNFLMSYVLCLVFKGTLKLCSWNSKYKYK